MIAALLELETAARVAAEVSTHGLLITIAVQPAGFLVKGQLVRGTGETACHEHALRWDQLHVNPGLITPAVKFVESRLRESAQLGFVDRCEGGHGRTSIKKSHRAEGRNFVG